MYYNAMGKFTLRWRIFTQPPNDNFNDAIPISELSGQITASNTDATSQPLDGEPFHANMPPSASIWWKWTAPSDSTFRFDTVGSNFDTILAVYTGSSVGSLTSVVSNDDESSDITTSIVSFQARAGTQYYIAVNRGGIYYYKGGNNIVLNWRTDAPTASVSGKVSLSVAGLNSLNLPNATVSLEGTGFTASTDSNGRFTIPNILPGEYLLRINAPDIAPFVKAITVSQGQQFNDESLQVRVYTQSDIDAFCSSSTSIKGDTNGDSRIGLEDAIYVLQVVSGVR